MLFECAWRSSFLWRHVQFHIIHSLLDLSLFKEEYRRMPCRPTLFSVNFLCASDILPHFFHPSTQIILADGYNYSDGYTAWLTIRLVTQQLFGWLQLLLWLHSNSACNLTYSKPVLIPHYSARDLKTRILGCSVNCAMSSDLSIFRIHNKLHIV